MRIFIRVFVFLVVLATISVAAVEAISNPLITIYGEVDVNKGGKLSRVLIIDTTGDSTTGFSPAVDTRGTADIRHVTVENAGVGVRASRGVEEHPNFQFRNNTIRGMGNSIGLILDIPVHSPSQITRNVFENQSCGIDVSIDVVFENLPIDERVEAFEKFAEKLLKTNVFIKVEQAICGARG